MIKIDKGQPPLEVGNYLKAMQNIVNTLFKHIPHKTDMVDMAEYMAPHAAEFRDALKPFDKREE